MPKEESTNLVKPVITVTSSQFTLPDLPRGHVWVSVLKDGKEESYFSTSERQFNKSYANNPKYQIKKKEIK
jgi:hypothetical protein